MFLSRGEGAGGPKCLPGLRRPQFWRVGARISIPRHPLMQHQQWHRDVAGDRRDIALGNRSNVPLYRFGAHLVSQVRLKATCGPLFREPLLAFHRFLLVAKVLHTTMLGGQNYKML